MICNVCFNDIYFRRSLCALFRTETNSSNPLIHIYNSGIHNKLAPITIRKNEASSAYFLFMKQCVRL